MNNGLLNNHTNSDEIVNGQAKLPSGMTDHTTESKHKVRYIIDFIIIIILTIILYFLSRKYDLLEQFVQFTNRHEDLELDELLIILVYWGICVTFFAIRRLLELYKIRRVLTKANRDLTQAYTEIHRLKGIIPICASCKKVRDDQGYWHQVENYIKRYATVDFSHGICPECARKLYPDMDLYKGQQPPPE